MPPRLNYTTLYLITWLVGTQACVGHSHPTVVRAGQEALAQIQTNQRFLHPGQQRYVAKLLATFPPELNTVYLCNSGQLTHDDGRVAQFRVFLVESKS